MFVDSVLLQVREFRLLASVGLVAALKCIFLKSLVNIVLKPHALSFWSLADEKILMHSTKIWP